MTATGFEDIRYEVDGPAAIVTIARPERYNAFRGQTIEELIAAFRAAWADRSVRAIILTGDGHKAFCSGGDVKQRAETGDYGPTKSGLWEADYFRDRGWTHLCNLWFLKHSFNADTNHQGGLSNMAEAGLELFLESDEAREAVLAFNEKRKPDFARFA